MPPAKKEQLPVATPASIAAGLATTDANHVQSALNQLLTACSAHDTAQVTAEFVQLGIPSKLVELLQQSDKSVKLLACRQLAAFSAAEAGPTLRQAVANIQMTQALWALLEAYASAEPAIRAAILDPASAKLAAPKKPPGGRELVDPEDWLPGPSKYLLEAALRTLSSLAGGDAHAQAVNAADQYLATSDSHMRAEQQLWGWLCRQDPSPLVSLLQHPSGRVQLRALRLSLQLARADAWCTAFAAGGGVAVALTLAGLLKPPTDIAASGSQVQLAAMQLLKRAVQVSANAAAAVGLHRQDVLQSLMAIILTAATPLPVVPQAGSSNTKTKAAAEPPKQPATAGREAALRVQQTAAELLVHLSYGDLETVELLVQLNGLNVLVSLLPDPPPAPAGAAAAGNHTNHQGQQADEYTAAAGGGTGTVMTSGTHVQQGDARADLADAAKQAGAAAAANHGPSAVVVPNLELQGASDVTQGSAGRDRLPEVLQASSFTEPSSSPAGIQTGSSRPVTPSGDVPPPAFMVPGTKVQTPELQAKILHIIAAAVSHPSLVVEILDECVVVPRLLLHMFAARPSARRSAALPSSTPCNDASIRQDQIDSSKQPALVVAAAPVPAAFAAKTGAQTPRSSLAVKAAVPASSSLSNSGAASPRKAAAAAPPVVVAPPPVANSTSAAGKLQPPDTVTAPQDPLSPPYAACTKAAALVGLKHLAQSSLGACALAAQPVATLHSTGSCQAAVEAPVQQSPPQQRTLEQHLLAQESQQQQQQGRCQPAADAGAGCAAASMLQQTLWDLQQLCAASDGTGSVADHSTDMQGTAAVDHNHTLQQLQLGAVLSDAADLMEALIANLDTTALSRLPIVQVLQVVAKSTVQLPTESHVQQTVMRALVALPEDAFVPPPKPPLPSPPPTPPPPPLPTSQFAWDALDRPCITDGAVIISTTSGMNDA